VSADGVKILMANCVCSSCKRIMDCTGEHLCELCEILLENEVERDKQEMRRMRNAPRFDDEEWDMQP
jgi:hypothetical protein